MPSHCSGGKSGSNQPVTDTQLLDRLHRHSFAVHVLCKLVKISQFGGAFHIIFPLTTNSFVKFLNQEKKHHQGSKFLVTMSVECQALSDYDFHLWIYMLYKKLSSPCFYRKLFIKKQQRKATTLGTHLSIWHIFSVYFGLFFLKQVSLTRPYSKVKRKKKTKLWNFGYGRSSLLIVFRKARNLKYT